MSLALELHGTPHLVTLQSGLNSLHTSLKTNIVDCFPFLFLEASTKMALSGTEQVIQRDPALL